MGQQEWEGEGVAVPVDASEWWVVLVRDYPELFVGYILAALLVVYIISFIPPFSGIAYKAGAWTRGIIHMLARRESKVNRTDMPRPEALRNRTPDAVGDEKEFIFIRHGESEWNEVFNRGKVLLLPRLIIALIREAIWFPWKGYSLFLDSPLCKTGLKQAEELKMALQRIPKEGAVQGKQNEALLPVRRKMHGDDSGSVIVSSNLRRCVETALIALEPRLRETREKVKLYSCLQEVAPNVDTLALSDKGKCPSLNKKIPEELRQMVDASNNLGSKRWFERSIKRLDAFLKFAFAQKEKRIIVSGHSFYFRELFKRYIDDAEGQTGDALRARTMKIRNCGVVRCVIQKGKQNTDCAQVFRIKPDSIQVLFPCPEPHDPKLKGFVK
eukprot:TRINITY_DN2049_c1_g1_i1.p1 TRINITY_DN2049_c1_g1~~TRINITY_DN2049_c1_g1_i1.p1  ORF type:complete len:384 (+),score=137.20 TRINITY_DN2049_c1_g1_i1:149-1300(+)